MKILLLAGRGESTNIVYHYLSERITIDSVIMEDAVLRKEFLKKRIKKLGFFTVLGQILFVAVIETFLRFISKKRREAIYQQYHLDNSEDYRKTNKCHFVNSVNSDETYALIQELQPDVIIINGTRIISKRILECVNAPFINTHAGITPKYRGVHGAYWAKYNQDDEHCGVTVHLVDAGVDTGNILYQALIESTGKDNYCTYPLLQLAKGLPYLYQSIQDCAEAKLQLKTSDLPSKQYYHPTIFQYLYAYIKYRVK